MTTSRARSRYEDRLSEAARGMRFSAIRRMSALIEKPGIISFAPGQPSPETFPVAAFQEILGDVVARESAGAFQYILTRGLASLIAAVQQYAADKGMPTTTGELMMTEGSPGRRPDHRRRRPAPGSRRPARRLRLIDVG